jgi:hypothetical protein
LLPRDDRADFAALARVAGAVARDHDLHDARPHLSRQGIDRLVHPFQTVDRWRGRRWPLRERRRRYNEQQEGEGCGYGPQGANSGIPEGIRDAPAGTEETCAHSWFFIKSRARASDVSSAQITSSH